MKEVACQRLFPNDYKKKHYIHILTKESYETPCTRKNCAKCCIARLCQCSALLASDFGAQKRSTSAAAIMNSSIDASSLYALRCVVFPEKTEPNWSALDTYTSHTSSSPPPFFSPSSANGTDSVGSHLSLGNNQQSGIAVDAEDVAQKLRLGQVRRGAEWLWRCGANHLKPHL